MTHRLVIHLPDSSIIIDSDNIDKLTALSNFCKENLAAYNASGNHQELTIDFFNKKKSSEIYSMILQLGL